MAFTLEPGGWDLGTKGKACEQHNEKDLGVECALGWPLHWAEWLGSWCEVAEPPLFVPEATWGPNHPRLQGDS